MKTSRLLFLSLPFFVASVFGAPPEKPGSLNVAIDPATSHGKWEGWGVSLCWWAKVFGDRKDVADVLFTTKDVDLEGQKLAGLGFNIARYNAGACSWNEIDGRRMVVSKTILPFRQIEGFWLDGKNADPKSASWDWNADANQRAMLGLAKERGADRFELFSNSPMWWMCANDNPSGRKNGRETNLPEKNYPAFATYLATIAAHAKKNWDITFTTVEPFNEPVSGYWVEDGKQEGAYFSAAQQRKFLPILRQELDRQGLKDMPIAASDETSFTQALDSWKKYDAPTKRLVDQVNVHGYEGTKGPRAELYEAVVKRDGKPLWNSEHGDKIGDGLPMVRSLNLDLEKLHPTAWVYWQAFDGGNNGGWGLFGADLIKKTIAPANPKYFALAQYSRHIRPGMTILDAGAPNTVAAFDPASRKLVVVAFNDGPAREATYDLSRFATASGPVASWLTEPLGKARYASQSPLALTGKTLKTNLPANSIQTFEIPGVSLN